MTCMNPDTWCCLCPSREQCEKEGDKNAADDQCSKFIDNNRPILEADQAAQNKPEKENTIWFSQDPESQLGGGVTMTSQTIQAYKYNQEIADHLFKGAQHQQKDEKVKGGQSSDTDLLAHSRSVFEYLNIPYLTF